MDHVKRLSRELIHKGQIIDIYTDHVQVANGNTADWDFIQHKGAAAMIAEDEDGKILMVRQFRNAIDKESLEIPAGGLNLGEDMKTCALRELEEETGYKAQEASYLIALYTTVAFCNERIEIYYTKNMVPSHQNLDEDEDVLVEKYELSELVKMIFDGVIDDSKTISAILAYQSLKQQK